ncbi:hypothetical protein BLA27_10130 [Brucella cytisi]|uniref:Solute-binding protein family 5 domain-containing protein n=2 Tax=Brucella cytisi TaxID=407152 RepID=A0A1J6HMP3_9HYPH|nr:hypothetical protein BLA27_10130 [Brucella cytisi]
MAGLRTRSAVFALTFTLVSPALAAELQIGMRSEMVMDPHFMWSNSNAAYYVQTYGYLLQPDEKAQMQPMLAASWKAVDDTTWEFQLRDDAKFHDGTPVTAEDVVASFSRAANLPGAAAPYTGAMAGIKEVTAPDRLLVRITTDVPLPPLPYQAAQIPIIPKRIATSASTADFANLSAAIGAGPYKFSSYVPGDRLVVERFDGYFGPRPEWDKVTFKFITDNASRTAALLAGSIDVADAVATSDVKRLREDPNVSVHNGTSDRVIYMAMDTERDRSPFITDNTGVPLEHNPFKDIRVRQAVTHAINRQAIVDRVMDGLAVPASQMVPPGFGGYNPDIQVPAYDRKLAGELLAKAGYPEGFGLTIHCPNDRYVNDARVCQAVGQQLAQIKLKVKVETLPRNVYFPKVLDHKGERFSFFMFGWGSSSGGEAEALWQIMHSYDPEKQLGAVNSGHYSNPKFDGMVEEALKVLDAPRRHALEQKAMEVAMEDVATIPLHYQAVVVGTRKGLDYRIHADESTLATAVTTSR